MKTQYFSHNCLHAMHRFKYSSPSVTVEKEIYLHCE